MNSKHSRSEFITKILAEQNIPAESLNRFASIPWTNRWFLNPAYKTFSRYLKQPTGEDFFFSQTLSTPETIPHMVSFVLKDLRTPRERFGSSDSRPVSDFSLSNGWQGEHFAQPDLVVLLEFGRDGVNGHPSIVHGGVSAALLDEAMGSLVMMYSAQFPPNEAEGLLGPFTANLNINYRAPVSSSRVFALRCWLVGRERRKLFTRGVMTDKDERILVQGEAIWISVKVDRL